MKHPFVLVYLLLDPFRGDRIALGVLTEAGFVENQGIQDMEGSMYYLASHELGLLRKSTTLDRPALCGPYVAVTEVRYSPELEALDIVAWVKQAFQLEASTATHSFGWALNRLKHGRHVARHNWNGKGMFLVMEPPSDLVTQPYIGIWNARGKFQPGWTASQEDMLATDWTEVKDQQDEESE